jgi:hypothetical protein
MDGISPIGRLSAPRFLRSMSPPPGTDRHIKAVIAPLQPVTERFLNCLCLTVRQWHRHSLNPELG